MRCELDPAEHPKGSSVGADELARVNLTRHEFHGDWNYTIKPRANP